jgi:hypothetical protein
MNDRGMRGGTPLVASTKAMCEDPSDDCKGGLVGTAHNVMRVLGQCHMATESLRDGLLPPAPQCASMSDKVTAPDDLTSLLADLQQSALELREKLAGLRETLRG